MHRYAVTLCRLVIALYHQIYVSRLVGEVSIDKPVTILNRI